MVPNSPMETTVTRLVLCNRSPVRGGVDAVWWPRGSKLAEQLPDLLRVFEALIGDVRRVVYDSRMWPDEPRRLIRRGVPITVDPYRMTWCETLYLAGTHMRDAVIYVLPSGCEPRLAGGVLDMVSAGTTPLCSAALRELVADAATRR